MKYDLEERTAVFSERIIICVKNIHISPVNSRIISQVVGSSGSIAANYCEAIEGESKKDFVHKISIAKKEIKEAKLWIRLLSQANPEKSEELREILKEAQELLLIFSKIIFSSRNPKI